MSLQADLRTAWRNFVAMAFWWVAIVITALVVKASVLVWRWAWNLL